MCVLEKSRHAKDHRHVHGRFVGVMSVFWTKELPRCLAFASLNVVWNAFAACSVGCFSACQIIGSLVLPPSLFSYTAVAVLDGWRGKKKTRDRGGRGVRSRG